MEPSNECWGDAQSFIPEYQLRWRWTPNILGANDEIVAVENWRSMMDRYVGHCAAHGLEPVDISSFGGN